MPTRTNLLERARTARRPSKYIDFRAGFDVALEGDWCELIKDIVAFANSGGGVILFGLSDDGRPVTFDHDALLAIGPEGIAEKIARYTDYDDTDIEFVTVERDGASFAALVIGPAEVPLPFSRAGTHDTGTADRKTAFERGALYVRHGAKSEPATYRDLIAWRDREIAGLRREWLGGIRQVVRAPPGHTVTVVPSAGPAAAGPVVRGPISTTGGGTKVVVQNADEIWPYRQQELLREIHRRLPSLKLTSYDVQCANWKLGTLKSRPEFAFRSHPKASPQYSEAYVHWFVEQGRHDPAFFQRLREERHQSRLAAKSPVQV